jgi:hypothetical protein
LKFVLIDPAFWAVFQVILQGIPFFIGKEQIKLPADQPFGLVMTDLNHIRNPYLKGTKIASADHLS